MSGIRVISGIAIDWQNVSRLAQTLGFFDLIILPGCATHGSPAGEVLDHGAGPAQPITSNSTEEGRAKNRRVEIKLVGMPQPISAK